MISLTSIVWILYHVFKVLICILFYKVVNMYIESNVLKKLLLTGLCNQKAWAEAQSFLHAMGLLSGNHGNPNLWPSVWQKLSCPTWRQRRWTAQRRLAHPVRQAPSRQCRMRVRCGAAGSWRCATSLHINRGLWLRKYEWLPPWINPINNRTES